MAYLAVNKNSAISVYKQGTSTKIGTINPNEAFVCYGDAMANGQVGAGVKFLNASGSVVSGAIPSQAEKYRAHMKAYPYGTATVLGTKRNVFKMRRIEKIVTGKGNFWGNVASGSLVVVDPDFIGDTTIYCKITYVQKSDGTWQKVDGDGYSYGFLDHGLDNGSYNSNMSMYGTWG